MVLSESLLSINSKACDPAKTGMKLMSVAPLAEPSVAQLIDANLDRSREGLRVIEDWCRFSLKRQDLVVTIKDCRQKLGRHHHKTYKNARSTITDEGLGLKHPFQDNRKSPEQIIEANSARVQEALRVLEEFARTTDPALAKDAAEIRYLLYDLEITVLKATVGSERRHKLQKCNLCLITKPHKNLESIVKSALKAGVKMIQYREKDKDDHEKLVQAKELALLCKHFGALFIVNDRVDIALAIDADGVHLGQKDFPTSIARSLIGHEKLLGRSTHCLEELKRAEEEGCDFLGVGPINATETKPQLTPVGLAYAREASTATRLPWFAIGGINQSNLLPIKEAGAKRIAVVGAIMDSSDPSAASIELLEDLI